MSADIAAIEWNKVVTQCEHYYNYYIRGKDLLYFWSISGLLGK